MFLEVQECIMDVNDCSWMLMHGCQWAVFALTRWCGNEHGGHNWPRCLAAFANLGHLCTCRTSSLSPSQLCLKSSCSSWFSHRKPVMVCLNWRMPQVMIRCGRFGCWKRRFWTIGCWGCSFRENSCQRRLNGTRLLRVRVWLGLSGTFFFCYGTVKIMCLLSFCFIWKCLLRETSYLALSWTFRGKNQPCHLWRQDSVRTCQIMNFARSFLGTLMSCVIVLSLF